MDLSHMRACSWEKNEAKFWYYAYNSDQAYGLEAGLEEKGNELLAEQLLWIDGSSMDIDAARVWVWEWRKRNERAVPVEKDRGGLLSGASESDE